MKTQNSTTVTVSSINVLASKNDAEYTIKDRRAAILEAVYRRGMQSNCQGRDITIGQVVALSVFNKDREKSAHRAIAAGLDAALTLKNAPQAH